MRDSTDPFNMGTATIVCCDDARDAQDVETAEAEAQSEEAEADTGARMVDTGVHPRKRKLDQAVEVTIEGEPQPKKRKLPTSAGVTSDAEKISTTEVTEADSDTEKCSIEMEKAVSGAEVTEQKQEEEEDDVDDDDDDVDLL